MTSSFIARAGAVAAMGVLSGFAVHFSGIGGFFLALVLWVCVPLLLGFLLSRGAVLLSLLFNELTLITAILGANFNTSMRPAGYDFKAWTNLLFLAVLAAVAALLSRVTRRSGKAGNAV